MCLAWAVAAALEKSWGDPFSLAANRWVVWARVLCPPILSALTQARRDTRHHMEKV
jgi:hypothetical protein